MAALAALDRRLQQTGRAPFPVARPAWRVLIGGFNGNPPRHPSAGIDDKDSRVSILPLRVKYDPAAIGRPARCSLVSSKPVRHLNDSRTMRMRNPGLHSFSLNGWTLHGRTLGKPTSSAKFLGIRTPESRHGTHECGVIVTFKKEATHTGGPLLLH